MSATDSTTAKSNFVSVCFLGGDVIREGEIFARRRMDDKSRRQPHLAVSACNRKAAALRLRSGQARPPHSTSGAAEDEVEELEVEADDGDGYNPGNDGGKTRVGEFSHFFFVVGELDH